MTISVDRSVSWDSLDATPLALYTEAVRYLQERYSLGLISDRWPVADVLDAYGVCIRGAGDDPKDLCVGWSWAHLLRVTASGRPFVVELLERGHLPLARFVWWMMDWPLRSYDPVTREMIIRSMTCVAMDLGVTDQRQAQKYGIDLEPLELQALGYFYKKQSSDPVFIQCVQQVFEQTFVHMRASAREVRHYTAKKVPTMLLTRLPAVVGLVPGCASIAKVSLSGLPYGYSKFDAYLHEMLYARSNQHRAWGVYSIPADPSNNLGAVLAVDFARYIEHRAISRAFYDRFREKRLTLQGANAFPRAVRVGFTEYFRDLLKDFPADVYYAKLRELLVSLSLPAIEDPDTTFLLPRKAFVDHIASLVPLPDNKPLYLMRNPPKYTCAVRNPRQLFAPRNVLQVWSPVTRYLPEPALFRVARVRKQLLVSPPWPLEMRSIREQFPTVHSPAIAVVDGRTYVSLQLLPQCRESENYCSADLVEWLETYQTMSIAAFELSLRRMYIDNEQLRVKRVTNYEKGAWFTSYEDEEIIERLRPKMTREQKAELQRVCHNRDYKSICRRAAVLRAQLFADGVFDMTRVPHAARTEELFKELKASKQAYACLQKVKERAVIAADRAFDMPQSEVEGSADAVRSSE